MLGRGKVRGKPSARGRRRPKSFTPGVIPLSQQRSLRYPKYDLREKLEILLTDEDPQQGNDEDWYQHEGEEFGFILEGRYEVIVEGRTYVLEE